MCHVKHELTNKYVWLSLVNKQLINKYEKHNITSKLK